MRQWLPALIAAASWIVSGDAARAQDRPSACVEGPSVVDGAFDNELLTAVLALRPTCVRVRLRLDLWSSIDDTAQRGPGDRRLLGPDGLYDELLLRLERGGAWVILTVGLDAARVTPAQLDAPAARTAYAQTVRSLAARYRERVRAIELEGAPNARAPGATTAEDTISPARYASMLLAVQAQMRDLEQALRCVAPRVIVGGVLDAPAAQLGSSAQAWVVALYEALAMDPATAPLRAAGRDVVEDLGVQVRAEARSGFTGDLLADGAGGMLFMLDWVFRHRAMGATAPRVWLTAGAYRTDGTERQDQRQMIEAQAYFNPRNYASAPIQPVVLTWSPLNEPVAACEGYGVYRGCAVTRSNVRATYDAIFNGVSSVRPDPWARLEFTDPLVRVTAGQTEQVHLRVTNASPQLSTTAPWAADTDLWIGPPTGCPDNQVSNNLPWTDLPPGSVSSATVGGARLRYVPTTIQPPTVPRVVTWRVAPPRDLAPGRYTLAARMQQGTRWFGPAAVVPVEVLAPAMDAGPASSDAAVDAPPTDITDLADLVEAGDRADVPPAPIALDVATPRDVPLTRDATADEGPAPSDAPATPPDEGPAPSDAPATPPDEGFADAGIRPAGGGCATAPTGVRWPGLAPLLLALRRRRRRPAAI